MYRAWEYKQAERVNYNFSRVQTVYNLYNICIYTMLSLGGSLLFGIEHPVCMELALWVHLGFPFYVKKLFTRNIVTDVTDVYYVVITVVTT
jgi:hypothetical protein